MANDWYFRLNDDDDKIRVLSKLSQEKLVSGKDTAPYIAIKLIERIDLVLDTPSTEYTWQTFSVPSDKSV